MMQGYFAEGSRKNLLSSDLVIDGAQVQDAYLGPETWEIFLAPGEVKSISLRVNIESATEGLTFSCIATGPSSSIIKLAIATSEERRIVDREMRSNERVAVSMRFARPTLNASAVVELRNTAAEPAVTRIGYLMVEEGLFASSPIRLGQRRDADRLSYQRANNLFEDSVGSLLLLLQPHWDGHELLAGDNPHLLSCRSDDGQNSIDVYACSESHGALSLGIVREGRRNTIQTAIHFQKNRVYAVGLRYAVGTLELLVNGWSAGSFQIQLPASEQLGSQVYVGVGSDGLGGAYAVFAQLMFWKRWLDERELQTAIYEHAPDEFPWFYAAAIAATYSISAWPQNIVLTLLRYPRLWQETPLPWLRVDAAVEAHFRDEVRRSIASLGYFSLPESHNAEGRTDLLIESMLDGARVRVECKFWGRHDYNEVPAKPLKYFTTGERFGVVLMINLNKRKNVGPAYRQLVKSSPTDCIGIVDLPFGSSATGDHFVSLHQAEGGAAAEVLHIVMDAFGPFSRV